MANDWEPSKDSPSALWPVDTGPPADDQRLRMRCHHARERFIRETHLLFERMEIDLDLVGELSCPVGVAAEADRQLARAPVNGDAVFSVGQHVGELIGSAAPLSVHRYWSGVR